MMPHMAGTLAAWPVRMGGVSQHLLALCTLHWLLVAPVPHKAPSTWHDLLGEVVLIPCLGLGNGVVARAACLGSALATPSAGRWS
jgi:hypothetical protein